jgi:hypothetical protein
LTKKPYDIYRFFYPLKDKYYNVIENNPTASELWDCQRGPIIANLVGHLDVDFLENNDCLRSFSKYTYRTFS